MRRRGVASWGTAVAVLILLGATALILLGATACGSSTVSSGDRPVYESVEALTTASDIVVLGTVGTVMARELDEGTADEVSPGAGIPMVFYGFDIEKTYRGDVEGTIPLAWIDQQAAQGAESSRVEPGQRLLVFAERLTDTEAPGIESFDVFYVPTGTDNGVLDVEGTSVRARTQDLVGLTDVQATLGTVPTPLVVSLAEIVAVVNG